MYNENGENKVQVCLFDYGQKLLRYYILLTCSYSKADEVVYYPRQRNH